MKPREENDLQKQRDRIRSLDGGIMRSLARRFQCSEAVARYKRANRLPVYDPDREQAVVEHAAAHFPPDMKDRIVSLINGIIRVSREVQYDLTMDGDPGWEPGAMIGGAAQALPQGMKVCCLGTSGSYSHLTAAAAFPGSEILPGETFEECLARLESGECGIALLPLDNTTAGTVNDVYDLLTEKPYFIVRSIAVPIRHRLVVLPGSSVGMLRTVLSHPQALSQCSRFIRAAGMARVPVGSTAAAVQRLAELGDPTCCAIASAEACAVNGLAVLDDDINDSAHNQTRFVGVMKQPVITPGADRLSIAFRLPHRSGSLSHVLDAIAERGLNLTKIQSRPVPDRPWEYSFWADISARRDDRRALLVLYQLSRELPLLKFIGWYEETTAEIMKPAAGESGPGGAEGTA